MTGKLELVYEGEQQGEVNVAEVLIGRAVKAVFIQYFPDAFENGNKVELSDILDDDVFCQKINQVDGLREIADKHIKTNSPAEQAAAMEFVLEGLHQNSRLSKNIADGLRSYSDMMGSIFDQ